MDRIIPGTNFSVNGPLGEVVPVILHRYARIVLTDDQIKELPNEQYTILPAPGENKIILAQFAILSLLWFGDYDDVGATSYIQITPSGLDILDEQGNDTVSQLLQSGESTFVTVSREHSVITDWGTTTPSGNYLTANLVNQPLVISAENADVAFTGGHASNTLTVGVTYFLFNTSTGLFE